MARPINALALAAGEQLDGRIDGKAGAAKADRIEQYLGRDLLLFFHVDETETIGDLPADEEIAPERLPPAERFVLIDRLD